MRARSRTVAAMPVIATANSSTGPTSLPAPIEKGSRNNRRTSPMRRRPPGWEAKDGLDLVQFTTVTQVAQPIYPRLAPGGCTVTYRAASRAVVPVLPNFTLAESIAGRYEEKSLRSPNMVWAGKSDKQRFAY